VKVTTQNVAQPVNPASVLADYAELAKVRIGFMVLVTAAIGFFSAGHAPYDLGLFLATVLGTMRACRAPATGRCPADA